RGELLGVRSGAIEGEQDALLVAERIAQPLTNRIEVLRERVVRWHDRAQDRPPVLVVDVVVGCARQDATILHAPSLPKRVLARIRPQVVVDEEDGRSIIVARGSKVPRRHTGGELRAARLAEPPEAPPDE